MHAIQRHTRHLDKSQIFSAASLEPLKMTFPEGEKSVLVTAYGQYVCEGTKRHVRVTAWANDNEAHGQYACEGKKRHVRVTARANDSEARKRIRQILKANKR